MILTQMKGLLAIWQKRGNITDLFSFLTTGTFLLATVIGGTVCLSITQPDVVVHVLYCTCMSQVIGSNDGVDDACHHLSPICLGIRWKFKCSPFVITFTQQNFCE